MCLLPSWMGFVRRQFRKTMSRTSRQKMEPPSSDGPFLWKAKPMLPNCTGRNHDFDKQRTGRTNPPFSYFLLVRMLRPYPLAKSREQAVCHL